MQGINSLLIDEEKLILERDKYIRKINEVRILFDQLPINIQIMMVELYVCGYNHTKVANRYNFARQYLYKLINKSVKKVLKNKRGDNVTYFYVLLWYCGNFERTPQSTVNQHFVRKKLERVSFILNCQSCMTFLSLKSCMAGSLK